MQNQIMCSESVVKLAKAMLKVQKLLNPACKDKFNNFTNSKYATLNSVMEACGEILIDAGIWMTQYPVPVDENNGHLLGLETKLVHAESGEWQSSLLVMPLPKNDPQGYGSALTYARRYALSSMVGLVTEDDDGNAACERVRGIHLESQNQSEIFDNHPRNHGLNLPKIDGIQFQEINGTDGNLYIIANGNTRNKSAILKETGFNWNSKKKMWIKKIQKIPA